LSPKKPHPSRISPQRFISFSVRGRLGGVSADFDTTEGVRVVNSFDAMGLKEQLLRGIYQYGFEKPSAIQQRAILPIIDGRDVIAQAQSGTGKTSLIAITLCQLVDTQSPEYEFIVEHGLPTPFDVSACVSSFDFDPQT
jgi:hypothetical protein